MTDTDLLGPVVGRDEATAPFFDAARHDKLLIRRCDACARWYGPQVRICRACASGELRWERAAGTGELVTWSVVHSAPHRAFVGQLPIVVGYVELSEGPWFPARIVGGAPERLHVGAQMVAVFVHPTDGESYPAFALDPQPR